MDKIVIRGAREHNLRNIDVEIPRDKLTVITGLSGSGKSSLAFDTIYAEGQRRYVESLSAYARQFLELMQKPDVEFDRGAVAGDLDRAEDHLEEPALDRRHGHRDLRLHAAAVGARRRAALARHRPADREPDGEPDGRSDRSRCRKAAGCCCWRRSCAAARASTEGAGGPAEARLPAGQGRRRALRDRRRRRRSTRSASTTSRWWSTGWWCGRASARGWPRAWRRRSS